MKWIFGVIMVWLVFVMSLTGWWLYFGITTLSNAAGAGIPSQLARHQRMLFTEGCVLLVSLLIGGLALFYFSYQMYREKAAKEMFFASFTHDLKTALFRLQLEVEKLSKKSDSPEVNNILGHTRKMQLDLENSLDSTIGRGKKLFIEKIDMQNFLLDLHAQWPEFSINLKGESQLTVDKKALHSIFKNLLHNSFVHGQADEVSVELQKKGSNFLIHYSDNGKIFEGDYKKLGQTPHFSSQGSGFGLYIVRQWVKKLGGEVDFNLNPKKSLQVEIELPGRVS